MNPKHFAPFVAAVVGWGFTQLAFTSSAANCRMIYGVLGALAGFGITGVWVWMGHLPVKGSTVDLFPPQQHCACCRPAPFVDYAHLENQRELARQMWLQGEATPPTDWYGYRG